MRSHGQGSVLLAASNLAQLRAQLATIDVDVPSRTDGRTTEQVERWSVTHALATLAAELHYPLQLTHADRPDFLLAMGGRTIGIEHVEVIPENYASMLALRERHHPDEAFFVPHHLPNEPKQTAAEIRTAVESECDEDSAGGDGWVGDSAEREWADAVLVTVERKARKVQSGYRATDALWLLAYDGWPLPHIDASRALAHLIRDARTAAVLATFERVLVSDDNTLWDISSGVARAMPLQRP